MPVNGDELADGIAEQLLGDPADVRRGFGRADEIDADEPDVVDGEPEVGDVALHRESRRVRELGPRRHLDAVDSLFQITPLSERTVSVCKGPESSRFLGRQVTDRS